MYDRRPTSLALPFMIPGFRHANTITTIDSKGCQRCFYLNPGNDHPFSTNQVLLASGVATYIADGTFGHQRRPFVEESPA